MTHDPDFIGPREHLHNVVKIPEDRMRKHGGEVPHPEDEIATVVMPFAQRPNLSLEELADHVKAEILAGEWESMLICGIASDGAFMSRSSSMERKDALWLAECLKMHCMGMLDE